MISGACSAGQAQPGKRRSSPQASATAGLDRPAAAAIDVLRAGGTKERPLASSKQTEAGRYEEHAMTATYQQFPAEVARGQDKMRIGSSSA